EYYCCLFYSGAHWVF
nr:immunoglobulin light chain junction region [Macaca mulatta]